MAVVCNVTLGGGRGWGRPDRRRRRVHSGEWGRVGKGPYVLVSRVVYGVEAPEGKDEGVDCCCEFVGCAGRGVTYDIGNRLLTFVVEQAELPVCRN